MTPEELACLSDVGDGLTLQTRPIGDTDWPRRPAWGRLGGAWHAVTVVARLRRLGFLQRLGASEVLVLSPEGVAWLQAHPPPGK